MGQRLPGSRGTVTLARPAISPTTLTSSRHVPHTTFPLPRLANPIPRLEPSRDAWYGSISLAVPGLRTASSFRFGTRAKRLPPEAFHDELRPKSMIAAQNSPASSFTSGDENDKGLDPWPHHPWLGRRNCRMSFGPD